METPRRARGKPHGKRRFSLRSRGHFARVYRSRKIENLESLYRVVCRLYQSRAFLRFFGRRLRFIDLRVAKFQRCSCRDNFSGSVVPRYARYSSYARGYTRRQIFLWNAKLNDKALTRARARGKVECREISVIHKTKVTYWEKWTLRSKFCNIRCENVALRFFPFSMKDYSGTSGATALSRRKNF